MLFIGEPFKVGEATSAKIDFLFGAFTGSRVETYLSFLFLAAFLPPLGTSILIPLICDPVRSIFDGVLLLAIDSCLLIPKAFIPLVALAY